MKLLVLNGPNLNFLGIREKGIYGNQDYAYLVERLQKKAEAEGHELEVFQSNYEGGLIDKSRKPIIPVLRASSLIQEHLPTTAMR